MAEKELIYRYERKFYVEELKHAQLVRDIKNHPAIFREIYHPRQINNIYFDSLDLHNYFENKVGSEHRSKFRIRWYGETFGPVSKPVLEVKIKAGLMGTKEHYPLPDFVMDENFSIDTVHALVKDSNMPGHRLIGFKNSEPTVLNAYQRTYYLSADGKFRLTLDKDLYSCRIGRRHNSFVQHNTNKNAFIVELKYDQEDDKEAGKIGSKFKFRMTKSSKYVEAVENIYLL